MPKICTCSSQMWYQHWKENSHGFPSLTKKLFAFDSHWERDNQFSLVQCHCEYQPHSRVGPNQDSLTYTKGAPCFSAHVLIGVFWFTMKGNAHPGMGPGKMAQWLSSFAAPVEDPSSDFSTCTATPKNLNLQFRWVWPDLLASTGTHGVHIPNKQAKHSYT